MIFDSKEEYMSRIRRVVISEEEIKQKLKEAGKELLVVGKFFASSQLCSFCGHKYEKVRDLSVREWICPCCNAHHNRDINAATNIRNEGMRILEADKEHESVV